MVAVIQAISGITDIDYSMRNPGWSKHIFPRRGMEHFALKTEFDFPFDQHQQLVRGVNKVLPHLSGWIAPYVATETLFSPSSTVLTVPNLLVP